MLGWRVGPSQTPEHLIDTGTASRLFDNQNVSLACSWCLVPRVLLRVPAVRNDGMLELP